MSIHLILAIIAASQVLQTFQQQKILQAMKSQ
jgi:hypothetical protein